MAKKKNIEGLEKELYSDRERMEIWIGENWKKCVILAAVVVVAVVAVYSVRYRSEEKRRAAIVALASAKAEELPAVLAKYPDSPGAATAKMRLAEHLMSQKKYADAKARYAEVAQDRNAPAELRGRAKIAGAACDELSGNLQDAAAACTALMSDSSAGTTIREEAGFQAGRLLIALKEFDRAAEVLRNVADMPAEGESNYRAMAGLLLKSLQSGDFK